MSLFFCVCVRRRRLRPLEGVVLRPPEGGGRDGGETSKLCSGRYYSYAVFQFSFLFLRLPDNPTRYNFDDCILVSHTPPFSPLQQHEKGEGGGVARSSARSEEHTSELQSP